MDSSLVVLVLIASGAIVGVIEWVKKLAPKAPTLTWHIILLPLCLVAALILPVSIERRLLLFGALLLITQVGYQLIVQGVVRWFKGIATRAAGPG